MFVNLFLFSFSNKSPAKLLAPCWKKKIFRKYCGLCNLAFGGSSDLWIAEVTVYPLNCLITDWNFWRIWMCVGTHWCCFVCPICPNALPFISIYSHLGLLPCIWKFHSQSSYSFQQNGMCDELLYVETGLKNSGLRRHWTWQKYQLHFPLFVSCMTHELRKCWLDNSVVYWILSSNVWSTPMLQCYSLLLSLIFLVT